jgi:aminoacylase
MTAAYFVKTSLEFCSEPRPYPSRSMESMRALLDEWCGEEGLEWEFAPWTQALQRHHVTGIGRDASPERKETPWWSIFKRATEAAGVTVEAEIFPAATDSRFLREHGINAFGFSPMPRTPVLLHEHNEWLGVATFLEGVKCYIAMLPLLAGADALPGEVRVDAEGTESVMQCIVKRRPMHAASGAMGERGVTSDTTTSSDSMKKRPRAEAKAARVKRVRKVCA